MNMRTYYHLLTLKRSKYLLMSQRRCVHQTSPLQSHHLFRHLRTPPPPQPPLRPSIFSSFGHMSINKCNKNAIGSLTFIKPIHSTLNPKHYLSKVSTIHTSELPLYDNNSPLDYRVTIKGKEVIFATSITANEHWLPLTNLDLLLPPIEVGVFFCYKKKNNMSPEIVVDTIKKSLAGVLSTFYPLAGEIVQNSHGEPEVVCNNSGVEFVHAHADVELKDLDFYHPDRSIRGKLMPQQINRGLLSVQVTELNCGSMIISCVFNHQLSDGYSQWRSHPHFMVGRCPPSDPDCLHVFYLKNQCPPI